MADKTIKHFIVVRFFPWQDPKYPHDVLDVDFLAKQVPLAKNNILKSLENQTNKNFEVLFMVHEKVLSDAKYAGILSELKTSNVPIRFIKGGFAALAKDALNNYDFVINSRMDFDDFIYKDAVAETQSKVNECDNILLYGYCKGYQYIYGELYPFFSSYNGVGHIAILQSVILKSSFTKKIPFVSAYFFNHTKVKLVLKEFLEKKGLEFSESMFQQNTSTNAFIYFRHEFSHNQLTIRKMSKLNIPKEKPLTTDDITKKQLAEEFGFHYELKSIKDKEFVFEYDFKSTQAEELGFRQNLMSINWVE